jgi:DNA-binding MarR family transcriptional regulator
MTMLTKRQRQLGVSIKRSLRELSNQISLLNHQVGARVELRDVDLDCFDLISQVGPLSPGVLSRRAGLHPATLTGILDRLERGGWIARERDAADRRATLIRALPARTGELIGLYSGMNSEMDELCANYDEAQLEVIGDFLRRATTASETATEQLSAN